MEYVYKCQYCRAVFINRYELALHVRYKHKGKREELVRVSAAIPRQLYEKFHMIVSLHSSNPSQVIRNLIEYYVRANMITDNPTLMSLELPFLPRGCGTHRVAILSVAVDPELKLWAKYIARLHGTSICDVVEKALQLLRQQFMEQRSE